jgi:hypothetical protein
MSTLRTNCAVVQCLIIGLVAAVVMASSAGAARAQDASEFQELETKYIFGNFTIGSSTDKEGDKAFETETEADFGKRDGHYAAAETELEFEYSPTRFLQIELGPTVSSYDISNVPGLEDRDFTGLNGFEADIRSVILDRGQSPFAITASFEPEFHSLDETSGARVNNYGLETRLEADAELIKNRLYFGSNLLYEPETTRDELGAWDNESTWGISSALAYQIIPRVVVGADLWYLQHYEGIGFNTFTGDAVYLGPTLFWHIAHHVLMSAAWETQIAGHEVGATPGNLDLTDFSHSRARLLFEFEF